MDTDAVINPIVGKKSPKLGPVAVMAATEADCLYLIEALGGSKKDRTSFFYSNVWLKQLKNDTQVAVAGPFIGAPHAAMVLENLIVCGVQTVFFLGWCGAVSQHVNIGDIILAKEAFSDEGTSIHYGWEDSEHPLPTSRIPSLPLRNKLEEINATFYTGSIWTTDAIYRETEAKIKLFQNKGVLGVEMELSALIAICRFRNVDIASLQVISDDVSSYTWKPDFKNKRFKKNRRIACDVIAETCMELMDATSR